MPDVASLVGDRRHRTGPRATAEAATPPRRPAVRRRRLVPVGVGGPLLAAGIGVFVAAPWLDERLVWCGWVGAAAALLVVDRLRGWRGESLAIMAAGIAIAIAFHWTPEALAMALAAETSVGLAVAAPIAAWDAVRLAAPVLIAARLRCRPEAAWFPAALAAVVAEAVVPGVFPWRLGYAQVGWPLLVQAVDLLGAGWATFMFFAHAGAIAAIVRAVAAPRGCGRQALAGVLAVVVCGVNLIYGCIAFAVWQRAAAAAPTAGLLLVQADPGTPDGIDTLRRLTELACADGEPRPDLVCWPECSGGCYAETLTSLADPDVVLEHSRPPLAGLRPWDRPSRPLLFGGKLYRGHAEKPRAVHQAALLIDTDQSLIGAYRKRHLMPFGEYVPGGDWLPDLARWFAMQEELTPGTEATVLRAGSGIRAGVLLCYEDMLPEAARSLVDNSANVLVSLINGAAFPRSVTLAQHRMLAQLRAVENRRSLVRCAATGETCVVSPVGCVVASLPLHGHARLVARVPLIDAPTPAHGLAAVFPMACAAGLVLEIARRRRHGWTV